MQISVYGVEDGGESDEESAEFWGEVCEKIRAAEDPGVLKKIGDPRLPRPEQVEEHYLSGHIPFRNWCPVCVKSEGRELDHNKDCGKARELPEYSWDYCFPGDEFGFKWTVLVGKERQSKAVMGTTIPMKGGTGAFAVDKCLEFVGENVDGKGNIIVK